DAVGAGGEMPAAGELEQPGERTDATGHVFAVCGRDQRLHPSQNPLVRLDVDAGRGVRQAFPGHQDLSSISAGEAGSNCILSISSCWGTGTGYEPSKHARQNCSAVPRPMALIRPGIDRYARLSAATGVRASSTVRPDAISSLVEPISTPMKHGKRIGGLEIRMWISFAPAALRRSMIRRHVVARKIGLSAAMIRLPMIDLGSALSLSITPASRSDWSGW